MDHFLDGAIMLAAAAVGLLFLRSWRRTGDRLFALFALAFVLLSVERWVFLLLPQRHQLPQAVYLIRLAAFIVILVAFIDKNRE